MLISKIVESINARLAGEMLSPQFLMPFLDATIDDINTRLNTKFPVFSDLPQSATSYDCFPDKFIRNVVVPGAAYKFYITDEEGAAVAPEYKAEYQTNLFYMERDYLMLVPPEYLDNMEQGTYHFDESHPLCDGGFEISVGCFII